MKNSKYIVFSFLLAFCTLSYAQVRNLGLPFIQSFTKENYQAANQNSDIIQDHRGVVFFANNEGMLSFDGRNWQLYPLPNQTIMRSLALSDNGYIFVGGQNEFGFFRPTAKGDWKFESLQDRIPEEHRSFEDVWDIIILNDRVFFRASGKLFCFQAGKFIVFEQTDLAFLAEAGGHIYAQDEAGNLFQEENNTLKKLTGTIPLSPYEITGILQLESGILLISTLENGFYSYDGATITTFPTTTDDFFKQNHITTVELLANDRIAVATDFAGVLLMEAAGNALFHIDKKSDLLSNRVLSLHQDRDQNLWLGLDNGIGYLEISSPFTNILPDGDLEGAGYDVRVFEGQIYFSTSNGLYATPWQDRYSPLREQEFQLVSNSKGQTYGLDVVDNQLFMAHNKGAYLINNNRATQLYDGQGIWNFQKLNGDTATLLAGSYSDLLLFNSQNGTWQMTEPMNAVSESCRFVEQDEEGNIWVAHPYKGIFRIIPDGKGQIAQVKTYDESRGLPSRLHNHLFKIKNEIVFCAEQGVYEYNVAQDSFLLSPSFTKIFGTATKVRRLQETKEGNIWFITENELGKIEFIEKGLARTMQKTIFSNLNKNLNPGFEKIYSYDENNVFITYDKGFLHYHPQRDETDSTHLQLVFTKINFSNRPDSVLFAGVAEVQDQISVSPTETTYFNHRQNALQFGWTATTFARHGELEYRYFLEGAEGDWSNWRTEMDKEYTNLPPGAYTFQVQARYGVVESEALTYHFEIYPPWYWTTLAKALYLSIFIGLITWGGLKLFHQYRDLQAETQQAVEQSQAEIDKLREEKTEAELQFKKRELISTTMHLVQKNERLEDIKTQLIDIEKMNSDTKISKSLRSLLRQFNQDEVLDDGWEKFMMHFNQLHGNYFDRLKAQYPSLTPKDLKLCAYLRMNLTTKEIATLMNVTVRGVEASRYRLRRKLELDSDANLTAHLMHY